MAQNVAIEPASDMDEATPVTLTLSSHPLATEVMISAPSTLASCTDTDETIDAGWENLRSELSAASAPSMAETINVNPTPIAGSVPNSASVSRAAAAAAPGAMELTLVNISLHNMIYCPEKHLPERLWMRERGRSTVVSSNLPPEQASLTHASDMTIDLGEPFAPMSTDPQDAHVVGVGAWADVERPPMWIEEE